MSHHITCVRGTGLSPDSWQLAEESQCLPGYNSEQMLVLEVIFLSFTLVAFSSLVLFVCFSFDS